MSDLEGVDFRNKKSVLRVTLAYASRDCASFPCIEKPTPGRLEEMIFLRLYFFFARNRISGDGRYFGLYKIQKSIDVGVESVEVSFLFSPFQYEMVCGGQAFSLNVSVNR